MNQRFANGLLGLSLLIAAGFGLAAGGLSCSDDEEFRAPVMGGDPDSGNQDVSTGKDVITSVDTGNDVFTPPTEFSDFPANPVVGTGLPSNIGALFSPTGSATGGPCLAEPPIDAMIPSNWSPLYFEWIPASGQNVFELTLSVDNQTRDLVVYTSESSYTMDKTVWAALASHSLGHDIEVKLRGATLQGSSLTADPATGASGKIHLAPVPAEGAVVYWDASGATSFEGFRVGDTSAVSVLTPTSAGNAPSGQPTTCISCHASASKGKLLVYTADSSDNRRVLDVRMMDGTPLSNTMVSPSARTLLGRHKQSAPTTTLAETGNLQSLIVSILIEPTQTAGKSEIIWTDLLATDTNGWGILARNGDSREATNPSWSRDGTTIAYTSSDAAGEGVVAVGAMDIYTIPFNNHQGGTATPLPGASDATLQEFYPVYSPDDTLLAFNRSPTTVENCYNQATAEVYVVPGKGGTARRLRSNDPETCSGYVSPGLTNSWPRWAPTAGESNGKRYYWLVFSSKRRAKSTDGTGLTAQLYIAAVVTQVSATGEEIVQDYPAIYVAPQKPTAKNHTPVWDYFEVPSVPK